MRPPGTRWFNFEPSSYLEAGIAGELGGCEPEVELPSIGWEQFTDFLECGRFYE